MKKVLIMALFTVLVMACASKKPVQQQAESQNTPAQKGDPIQEEIDRLKKMKELRELRDQMEKDSIKHAQEMATIRSSKTLENGVQILLVPCTEEALKLENSKQMAAQGIATEKRSQEDAMLDANRVALSDITTRFLGVLKNGIEQYTKDTRAQSSKRGLESQLEGLAMSVGEKAIEKHFKVACREYAKNEAGNYNCYEALYVETEKVVEDIINAAEEEKVDFDKHLFRQRMQEELDRQAKEKQGINQQLLDEINKAKNN